MLFATDLDGTFLDDDKHFQKERFTELLSAWRAAGNDFLIATGREIKWLEEWFGPLLDDMALVASNGSVWRVPGQPFEQENINPAALPALEKLINQMAEQPVDLHGFTLNNMYSDEQHSAITQTIMDFVERVYGHIRYVPSLAAIDEPLTTVTGHWSAAGSDVAVQTINQAQIGVYATTSGYGAVDILPAGINKAVALQKVLTELKAQPQDLIAIGDGMNDLQMLQFAGTAYIMPNADQRLKVMPFKVAPADNNHAGVLDLMEELLTQK